jgi:hypothetical protein
MANHEKEIDELFREKTKVVEYPKDVVKVIEEIATRNDKIGHRSSGRVSLARTAEWVTEVIGFKITEKQIIYIARKHLGRKSWSRA